MIKKQTFTFLKNLKENNDRKWFHVHKDEYQIARKNFVDMFDDFTGRILWVDKNLRDSVWESHIFRLHKDVRFSHNKDPYKFHFSGYICPGWKPNVDLRACYYLHIEPGNNFIGGWAYGCGKEYLAKIRATIAERWDELERILDTPVFKKYFGKLSEESKLKTAPRWYPKDHKYIELLRFKSFSSMTMLSDAEVLSEDIHDILQEKVIAIKPLNDWFNSIHI